MPLKFLFQTARAVWVKEKTLLYPVPEEVLLQGIQLKP